MTDTRAARRTATGRGRGRGREQERRRVRVRAGRRGEGTVRSRLAGDRGSATAEYAVVILAAVAFAGVLVAVMRSGEVQQVLTDLVRGALVP